MADARVYRELLRQQLAEPGGALAMQERWFEGAIVAVIHAFNLTNDPDTPFAYDQATIDEVTKHCHALMVLQKSGRGFREKRGAVVQADPTFQRFIGRALEPVGKRRGRPGTGPGSTPPGDA